jgi:hypothetical protein
MKDECAFCGCAMLRGKQVSCEDCAAIHRVCETCAGDFANDDGLRLVA